MRKTKNDDSNPRILPMENSRTYINFDETECYSLEPITKLIKKKQKTKKRTYTNIPNKLRQELIEVVHTYGESIKEASKQLGIKYSCAKAICQVYKREGRFERKISGNKSLKKQTHEEIHEIAAVISSPLAETQITNLQTLKSEGLEAPGSLTSDSSLYPQEGAKQIISFPQPFAPQEPNYAESRVKPQLLHNMNSVLQPFVFFTLDPWSLAQERRPSLSPCNILYFAHLGNQNMIMWNPMYCTVQQSMCPQLSYHSYPYRDSQNQ